MKIISVISYEFVENLYKKEKSVRMKQRLLIILKAFKIKSSYKIANVVGTSHTKVQRWINRFNEFGINGLQDKRKEGRPTFLNQSQKKELEKIIERPRDFSGGLKTFEVIATIKNYFKINYTPRHVRRLLHKMGYSRIKPRPTHVRKDTIKGKEVVEELKKNLNVWMKNGQNLHKMNSV